MLVHHFLEKSAKRFPDKEAVVYGKLRLSYREIDRRANQLGNYLLASGVRKGDRVALVLDNSVNYIVTYFAILKIGGITVAQNTQNSASYLAEAFGDSLVRAVVTQNTFAGKVRKAAENNPSVTSVVLADSSAAFDDLKRISVGRFADIFHSMSAEHPPVRVIDADIASIIYTSGSTGKPRGAAFSHLNLTSNTNSIVEYLELTPSDRILVVLPFSYCYGKSLLHTHFKVGGSVVINNHFAFPRVALDEMIKERCTGFSGVPSNFSMLLERTDIRNRQFPDLRYITQAGGAMAPQTIKELRKALPFHTRIYIMYGQTEASARLSYLEPDNLERKLGSIGKAIPNVELVLKTKDGRLAKPGEEGEIVARGSNIMAGYWGQPEETAKVLKGDGLHTGDLAKTDKEGFIYIIGRTKDMIKCGANRISAKEIEEILLSHEHILEAAAIGVPDPIMGEAIKAFVVFKNNSRLSEKQIILFCRQRMALFKVPKYVEFLSSLPKNSSGKIMKHSMFTHSMFTHF